MRNVGILACLRGRNNRIALTTHIYAKKLGNSCSSDDQGEYKQWPIGRQAAAATAAAAGQQLKECNN
jgi:hypothetical protein